MGNKKIILSTTLLRGKGNEELKTMEYESHVSAVKEYFEDIEFLEISCFSDIAREIVGGGIYGIIFFSETMDRKAKETKKENPELKIAVFHDGPQNIEEDGVWFFSRTAFSPHKTIKKYFFE